MIELAILIASAVIAAPLWVCAIRLQSRTVAPSVPGPRSRRRELGPGEPPVEPAGHRRGDAPRPQARVTADFEPVPAHVPLRRDNALPSRRRPDPPWGAEDLFPPPPAAATPAAQAPRRRPDPDPPAHVDLRDQGHEQPVVMTIPVSTVPARTLDPASTPARHVPAQGVGPPMPPEAWRQPPPPYWTEASAPLRQAPSPPRPIAVEGWDPPAPGHYPSAGWAGADVRRQGRHAAPETDVWPASEPAVAIERRGHLGPASHPDVAEGMPAPLLTPWVGLEQTHPVAVSVLPGHRRDRRRAV